MPPNITERLQRKPRRQHEPKLLHVVVILRLHQMVARAYLIPGGLHLHPEVDRAYTRLIPGGLHLHPMVDRAYTLYSTLCG